MILHLFLDEKICNRIVTNFEEALPGQNIFVCFCRKGISKFVKRNKNIIFVDSRQPTKCRLRLDGIEKVLIHYLGSASMDFINHYLPKESKVKIYWALWGADLYNNIIAYKGYDIYYEKDFNPILSFSFKVKEIARKLLFRRSIMGVVNSSIKFISERVDYILTSKYEYEILIKYIGCELKATYIDKGPIYYPLEEVLGSLFGAHVSGSSIMIGNSASLTNNHVYAMEYLSNLKTFDRQINVPLSYGGDERYIRHIKKVGFKYWGDRFNSITDFLPLEEYNKLMLSNSVFIYGNWRQEGAGNIVVALYLGAKVFMSSRSPLYKRFRDYGVKLYLLEEMTQEDLDSPETEEVIASNRSAILKKYSKEAVIEHIAEIFS